MSDSDIISKLNKKIKKLEEEIEDYSSYWGLIGGLNEQIRVLKSTNWNLQKSDTLKVLQDLEKKLKGLYLAQIDDFFNDIFVLLEKKLKIIKDEEVLLNLSEIRDHKNSFKEVFEAVIFNSDAYTHIYTSVARIEKKTDYKQEFINQCFDFLINIDVARKARGRSRSKYIKIGGTLFEEISKL